MKPVSISISRSRCDVWHLVEAISRIRCDVLRLLEAGESLVVCEEPRTILLSKTVFSSLQKRPVAGREGLRLGLTGRLLGSCVLPRSRSKPGTDLLPRAEVAEVCSASDPPSWSRSEPLNQRLLEVKELSMLFLQVAEMFWKSVRLTLKARGLNWRHGARIWEVSRGSAEMHFFTL